jgi:hypothetical protein
VEAVKEGHISRGDQKANNTIEKVRELQRKLYLVAKMDSKRRFHALYDKVYRRDVLCQR